MRCHEMQQFKIVITTIYSTESINVVKGKVIPLQAICGPEGG